MLSHRKKNLSQLLEDLELEQVMGDINIEINGLSNDSRTVTPGNLFIAIKGYKNDGHYFIQEAIAKGAKAIICEQPYPYSSIPIIQVKSVRYAQALLAAEFFDHPSKKLQVIGITGTNGKSTSTFMINSILECANFPTGLLGTVYNKIGNRTYSTLHTTPDSIEIQNFLAEMVKSQINHAIIEVSSHGIALDRITGTKFDIGGITNITLDHLDLHQNMKEYIKTKGKFFSLLSKEGTAIFNADDPISLKLNSYNLAQPLTYSIDSNQSTIKANDITKNSDYTKFNVIIKKPFLTISGQKIRPCSFPVNLQCLGKHNIYNALLAITNCLVLDLNIGEVQKGLADYKGIFRRLEVIYNQNFKVINDTAHNPGSFQAVFEVIKEEKYKNLFIVNSIRGNRGTEINKENTKIIIKWASILKPKKLFISSAYDTSSLLDVVQDQEQNIVLEMLQESGIKIEYYDELKECIQKVCSLIGPKDLLVFLGAHSMDKATDLFYEIMGLK